MKRYIYAASEDDSVLDDTLSEMKSDFDYILDGLEKLGRMGYEKEALSIAMDLNDMLSEIDESIANTIAE